MRTDARAEDFSHAGAHNANAAVVVWAGGDPMAFRAGLGSASTSRGVLGLTNAVDQGIAPVPGHTERRRVEAGCGDLVGEEEAEVHV